MMAEYLPSKKLTSMQAAFLERALRGVEFNGSIAEWRLVHLGYITVQEVDGKRYARPTAQARALMGVSFGGKL